ncbi:TonB-dependent receptor [Flavobacterium palustre]|uniref:TonB-dependent receptor n=1 Tax=Flavobacterium palustre TaxID=1476463 RepID=A0ABQ1HIU6_9FLAO|nr:TonB-dependent receptor [Flavobacterium palustre]GGA79753.1 TonB-dependent receptor [Flavobacterium palustre]
MKLRLFILTLFITTISFAQSKGTISGVITDKNSNNETLPFATVLIKGTKINTTTDIDGKYTINIAPGSYTVQFSFVGYETKEVAVKVTEGAKITLNQTLSSGGYTLKDVVITGTRNRQKETALLLEQKNAVEIKQSIGAQEMSRKGVSDVEAGLTKVTGITKVESRGLFVRGLEDRYNNLQVNDLAVPSNSPFKKIIPLDLFPTDIVGYMDVFKTFNPNIYGDFAGATIDIHTSQPTNSYTKLSYGVGYTTNNNMSDFLLSSDADNTKSFFGFGGQERQLPTEFGKIPNGQINNNFESTWNVKKIKSPLNTSFGVTHADNFTLGKNSNQLKYILGVNFDNKYQIREGADRFFAIGQGEYDNNLNRSQYKFLTQASALLGLEYKTERLKLSTTSLFLKSTENQIQDQVGYTRNAKDNPNEIIRLNQYDESNFFTNQLKSEYKLTEDGNHLVKGGLSYTRTKYNQPDRKFINGVLLNENEVETRYGSNHLIRQFLDVENNFHLSGFFEYQYLFGKDEERKNKLSAGYNGYAEYMTTSYRFISGIPNGSQPANIVNLNNIDSSIQDDIANNNLSFTESTNGEYKTKLNNRVDGVYANLLFHVGEKLEINTGLRAENTIRDLKYRLIFDPIGSAYRTNLTEKLDLLPSLNIKYLVNENSNIRFAASRTITRPVLFETLPMTYISADGTSERGNENLKNSTNTNVDLKYEIFPTKNELFAVTLFGKHIQDPIERSFDNFGGGSGRQVAYYNNKTASIFGAEFEVIIELSRLSEQLEGLSFGANTSIMHTEAVADTNRGSYFDTFEKRQLQGASNWLVNADLKYAFEFNSEWKNTATLVYGVYGDRIYAVGIAGQDNEYEKAFHKLDFIWGQNINKKWDIKFSVNNILNPYYKRVLGSDNKIPILESSLTLQEYKRGTGFSTSISYTF